MKKINVGFVAGFMDGFSDEGLKKFYGYQKILKQWSKDLNFKLINYDIVIKNFEQAATIREKVKKDDIDFLLLFQPSYIVGDFVYEIMKEAKYIGLWAIEETRKSGPMPLASFVNMEQNAGIAKHNFKGSPKKVKWFFGDIEGKFFKQRFKITVKALNAVKNLKNLRVGQIGKLADGHINHMVEPRQLYKNLGVDLKRDYEIEDIIKLAGEIKDSTVEKELNSLMKRCTISRVSKSKVVDSVKMYLAVKKICRENDYGAVAFSCWPKLMPLEEMVGCLVNSMLNSAGIVAGCEADVLGTVSMHILRTISSKEVAIMDLPVFDHDDNSLLLWHCGSAPIEMANQKGMVCEKHYFADYDESVENCGPVTDMVFKPSEVTVFRICGESNCFYYFTGKLKDTNKPSFNGSRGWVFDTKLYNKPAEVMDIANTLLLGGLPHHFPIVLEDIAKYIEEFAYWAGLSKIRRYDYKDYLYV
ncbi:MAG: hypothetical protein R6U35_03645 [Candidatus Humimicrobiaceae bacterium]